jgi:hypothetical protein
MPQTDLLKRDLLSEIVLASSGTLLVIALVLIVVTAFMRA